MLFRSAHRRAVREYGTRRFWNPTTQRFGTVDLDGNIHDYGFTFLNNEAVTHGFATREQAAAIHAWLAGARTVEGDTSTGADIYRWRFGPRSTTKRNVEYYFWGWSNPERIAWGYQVQDGVISAAAVTGSLLVPVAYSLDWKIRLKSWDKFLIPLPFLLLYLSFISNLPQFLYCLPQTRTNFWEPLCSKD